MLRSLLSKRVRELLECIKNNLICVLKMNESLTGLERHEVTSVINVRIFIFGLTIPLKLKTVNTFFFKC